METVGLHVGVGRKHACSDRNRQNHNKMLTHQLKHDQGQFISALNIRLRAIYFCTQHEKLPINLLCTLRALNATPSLTTQMLILQ